MLARFQETGPTSKLPFFLVTSMADSNPNQDEELCLPRAAVNKMIKEMIPNIRVSNDARELILNCCTEFIHLLSSEANEICNKQTKKTISPEHIIAALEALGFSSYLPEVNSVLQQFKKQASGKKKSHRLENLGIPQEELLRQQQELFAKARIEQEQEEWMNLQQAMMQGVQTSQPYPAPHSGSLSTQQSQPFYPHSYGQTLQNYQYQSVIQPPPNSVASTISKAPTQMDNVTKDPSFLPSISTGPAKPPNTLVDNSVNNMLNSKAEEAKIST